MIDDLGELKRLRKRHNLTQRQLAKLAGVSQSLIAKVEAGMIDPSYNNVKKLTDVLLQINEEQEAKAGEIMNKKAVFVSPRASVSEAIRKMKQYDISQLPVIDRTFIVGLISEGDVLEAVHDGKDVRKSKVADIMNEAPPSIPEKTPQRVVLDLLRLSPIVIIVDKGHVKGVITKSDVLKNV